MEQKTEASQAVDERALFEQWANPPSYWWNGTTYSDLHTQIAWEVWQARAALKAQPAPTEAARKEVNWPAIVKEKDRQIIAAGKTMNDLRCQLSAQRDAVIPAAVAAQGQDSARLDAACDCDSPSWCKNYNRCHRQVCGFPLRGTLPKPI